MSNEWVLSVIRWGVKSKVNGDSGGKFHVHFPPPHYSLRREEGNCCWSCRLLHYLYVAHSTLANALLTFDSTQLDYWVNHWALAGNCHIPPTCLNKFLTFILFWSILWALWTFSVWNSYSFLKVSFLPSGIDSGPNPGFCFPNIEWMFGWIFLSG